MTTEPFESHIPQRKQHGAKKPSSAASNVAQAKAKKERDGKVGSISQTRAEHDVDPTTGEPTLTAVFPQKGGREPHHVDLSFLLAFPNLQPMFTEAFLCWGAIQSSSTRRNYSQLLRCYFLAYLELEWSNLVDPEDIDDELLAGFRDSLLNKSGRRGKALQPTTVTDALGVLRSVLATLITGPWARIASRIAERVPSGPIGAHQRTSPTEVLGMEKLLAILEAAEREVLRIEQRFANAQMLLAEGRTRLLELGKLPNNTKADYRDFGVCLAAVDEVYPGVIPDLKVIEARYPTLGGAVHYTHGLRKVSSHLYPSGRDLVPFALLLAFATVFNSDTTLNLKWQDINLDADRAGTPMIEIVGVKGRATRDMVRLLDPDAAVSASSCLSLRQMLACLRQITTRIRPHIPTQDADRLFVYVQLAGAKQPKAFGTNGEKICLTSGDTVWLLALDNFIKDNKLPSFSLGQLRPSILDLVQFMDGSLEAARKVGDHGSPATTWTHYTSGGVRSRYRERIGQVIMLRERWLETDGVIDPRRLAPGQDKGAATPGFSCLDPLDSQRPNQRPGRLCKDYGGCPSCPMAAAHPGDALCVAYYTALEAAIYRSQGTMSARTWIERWAPVLADLVALRAWIPPDVLETSRELSIRLPNVG